MAAKAPVVEAVKYALLKGWSLSQVKCPEFQNLPLKPKLVCMMRPRGKKEKEKKKAKKEDKKREREGKVTEMEDGTIYYEPESVYDLSKIGMRIDLLVSHVCISVVSHYQGFIQDFVKGGGKCGCCRIKRG